MISATERSHVLPLKEWRFEDQGASGIAIFPERESWARIPKEYNSNDYLALVCCPACMTTCVLSPLVQEIDHLGHVTPGFACVNPECTYSCDLWLDKWNNKPLYAMAVQQKGEIAIYYTNASCQAEARMHLGAAAKNSEIVSIGPAIGFFVQDKEGKVLSAD